MTRASWTTSSIPCAGVFRDNNIREDISLEKMAELKPVFDRSGGTITAANSTPLTDGAAAVLLASEEWANKRGIPVQAYLSLGRTSAVDFVQGEGLLMAPTVAVSELLKQTGLALQDFDYYEIHEAFAAQVLATLKAWESGTIAAVGWDGAKPWGRSTGPSSTSRAHQ